MNSVKFITILLISWSFHLNNAEDDFDSKSSNSSGTFDTNFSNNVGDSSNTNSTEARLEEGSPEGVNAFKSLNANSSGPFDIEPVGDSKASEKHKIIGSRVLKIEEAPYHVALFRNNYFICAGSIVSRDWIVTAAHCVNGGGSFGIRFGTTDCRKGGQIRHITTVVINRRFKIRSLDNDIAMLQVNKPFQWSSGVLPLSLSTEFSKFPRNTIVTGWASIEENNGPELSLGASRITTVPLRVCRKLYDDVYPITKKMICGNSTGVGLCQADSGSPLVHDGILYGIVTLDVECNRRNTLGLYTDVRKQYKWIQNVVLKHGGQTPIILD